MKITMKPQSREMAGAAPEVLKPRKRMKEARMVDVVNIT